MFSKQLEPYALVRHINDHFSDRLLLTINPVEANKHYAGYKVDKIDAEWTDKWWARIVKKMLKNKWLAKLIPYPLECLVYARYVSMVPEIKQYPENRLHQIYAQCAYWKMQGKTPQCVIFGIEDYYEFRKTLDFSMFMCVTAPQPKDGSLGTVAGLKCYDSPFVKGIIVVAI